MTAERRALIKQLEEKRGSRVITYVTGDRAPTGANIGDDAVRPIIQHLRQIGQAEQVDLFIYSRGGAIDVPWRLNNAFRVAADRWTALVPFRANSAATLLCLGADEIVMGRQAELGPIDPIMNFSRATPNGPEQESLSVEDIMAFHKFITERFDLRDEESRVLALGKLVDRLDAVTLGNAYRTHSHIRDLAKRMLTSRRDDMDDDTVEKIVRTLAEEVYAHGHAIGFSEAKEIGLLVTEAGDLDETMWELLESYEEDLRLLEPLDPFEAVRVQDSVDEDVTLAVVESRDLTHEFRGVLNVQAQRAMPQNLQVQLNMPIQLPPTINPADLPAGLDQAMQQAQQNMLAQAHEAVQEALKQQALLMGCQVRLLGGRWQQV